MPTLTAKFGELANSKMSYPVGMSNTAKRANNWLLNYIYNIAFVNSER